MIDVQACPSVAQLLIKGAFGMTKLRWRWG